MFGELTERWRVPEPVEGTFILMAMNYPVPELAEGLTVMSRAGKK